MSAWRTAAVLGLVVLSACDPYRAGVRGPTGGPDLAAVGHSIPLLAAEPLDEHLSRTRQVTMDLIPGRRLAQAGPAFDAVLDSTPSVVLVDLGENDLHHGTSQAQLAGLVEATLDRLAAVRCVVWVDMADRPRPRQPDWPSRAAAFNALLGAEADARANTWVATWSDAVRNHGEWLEEDNLHPSVAGQAAYAEFVGTEVDTFCGGPVASNPVTDGPAVDPRTGADEAGPVAAPSSGVAEDDGSTASPSAPAPAAVPAQTIGGSRQGPVRAMPTFTG
jgi:lysophospholipase L1-like esterase